VNIGSGKIIRTHTSASFELATIRLPKRFLAGTETGDARYGLGMYGSGVLGFFPAITREKNFEVFDEDG